MWHSQLQKLAAAQKVLSPRKIRLAAMGECTPLQQGPLTAAESPEARSHIRAPRLRSWTATHALRSLCARQRSRVQRKCVRTQGETDLHAKITEFRPVHAQM